MSQNNSKFAPYFSENDHTIRQNKENSPTFPWIFAADYKAIFNDFEE